MERQHHLLWWNYNFEDQRWFYFIMGSPTDCPCLRKVASQPGSRQAFPFKPHILVYISNSSSMTKTKIYYPQDFQADFSFHRYLLCDCKSLSGRSQCHQIFIKTNQPINQLKPINCMQGDLKMCHFKSQLFWEFGIAILVKGGSH